MNLGSFLVHLGHVLGILNGDDPTVQGLSTVDYTTKQTTPMIVDTSDLTKFYTGSNTPESSKFLSTLISTHGSDGIEKLVSHTGMTQEVKGTTGNSEGPFANSTDETGPDSNTTVSGLTGDDTNSTGETGPDTNTTVSGLTGDDTNTTGETGPDSNTTVSALTGDDTNTTDETGPDTNTTVSALTGDDTNTTDETGPDTNTTATEAETTVSGQTGTGNTVTDSTGTGGTDSTGTGGTEAPTSAPGLSRGAVAGIVIGCLLLVAVIAAAVVFFMKNRNVPPEAQRLRV